MRTRSLLIFFLLIGGVLYLGPLVARASTNIDPSVTNHWAWSDFLGWIDFYNTNSITVNSQALTGYASSSAGDISLDCHTTSVGNICATSNYQVTNDGAGNLSGWGWNDEYGWISFDCHNTSGCGTSNYEVYIDNNGRFNNYAWNDIMGWISFNCADYGACGVSNYKVVTSWMPTSTIGVLDSSTFDTGVTAGAQLNSVIWYGSQPAGTTVRFQFATSNVSTGPWNFAGPDGTVNTFYNATQGVPMRLSYVAYVNERYFRYRVLLQSDLYQKLTPRIDDIFVNWSP